MALSIHQGTVAVCILAIVTGCSNADKMASAGAGATSREDKGTSTDKDTRNDARGTTTGASNVGSGGKTTDPRSSPGAGGTSGVGGSRDAGRNDVGGSTGASEITGAGGTIVAGGSQGSTGGGAAKSSAGSAAGGAVVGSAVSGAASGRPPGKDFTETIGSVSFDMVQIPGGTFTLGCESDSCEPDTSPVENITVSDYHIMKTEVSEALWSAVGLTEGSWYGCQAFACELTKQTGKAYRMMTEAEFEYAAKYHLSQLSQIDGSEEWAFNSWETKYSCKPGDIDPLGPVPGAHIQKTRRDKATGDKITGRLIRSIDGIGPKCRLTISDSGEYPPGYPSPCDIRCSCHYDPENSYRDPQWVTGSNAQWTAGSIAIGAFDLRVWDDGTATLNNQDGQWFTSNNIAFVFVPSSGPLMKFPYIFLDANQGSLISDAGLMTGFTGRIERKATSNLAKPNLADLKSGAELAAAAGDDFKILDMINIPESAKKQDPRLFDTTSDCWFQNNADAGGTHNYRQDVDAEEFRFAVIDQGKVTMLANGSWYTVNNTLLHITHSSGYETDYLYAVASDGYLLHLSFQAYERADLKMFQRYSNSSGNFPPTCLNDSCSSELKKGEPASTLARDDSGNSTFVPVPCPGEGCD